MEPSRAGTSDTNASGEARCSFFGRDGLTPPNDSSQGEREFQDTFSSVGKDGINEKLG
jgi:hypothetical protein